MAHNIGMLVLGKVEANGQTARIGFGLIVGDLRKAGGVRKTCSDRGGFTQDVRRLGQALCSGGRGKRSREQQSFGVSGTKA